ncbi:flagellar biosynthesis anti-sigma factor FlgM [Pseudescherichia vulneris]|uniref:flagellar biosynthesis anti-sigma factor FlgM n=1 Tax=Pseudescherichia vulneris TaxID=566 RepID=UPI001ABFAF52|nr:flagellar biosynthesis anti-sigma factor FlgM [Pseudescherichia vulneris]MDU5452844.1 flagellar biosynthesis anti-sigma factor FlgM [Pseudescherichia vulneris]
MAITTPGVLPGQLASRDATTRSPSQPEVAKADPALSPCADDVTQQGVQAAQRSLADEVPPDVDIEKVSQMQTLLASPQFSIDADALASSMLDYFQTRGA